MNVELSDVPIPEHAEIEIAFSIKARVNVTALIAQRRVSKLLLDQVGNLLYGEKPNLVAGKRLLWRVPVWLGMPSSGPVGQVGTLDVDAETGEILYSEQILEELANRAHALAERTASPAE